MNEIERRAKRFVEVVNKYPEKSEKFKTVSDSIIKRLDKGEKVDTGEGAEKEYGVSRNWFLGVINAIRFGFVNGKKYEYKTYVLSEEGDPIKHIKSSLYATSGRYPWGNE